MASLALSITNSPGQRPASGTADGPLHGSLLLRACKGQTAMAGKRGTETVGRDNVAHFHGDMCPAHTAPVQSALTGLWLPRSMWARAPSQAEWRAATGGVPRRSVMRSNCPEDNEKSQPRAERRRKPGQRKEGFTVYCRDFQCISQAHWFLVFTSGRHFHVLWLFLGQLSVVKNLPLFHCQVCSNFFLLQLPWKQSCITWNSLMWISTTVFQTTMANLQIFHGPPICHGASVKNNWSTPTSYQSLRPLFTNQCQPLEDAFLIYSA